jgi:hypothetical protein
MHLSKNINYNFEYGFFSLEESSLENHQKLYIHLLVYHII